MKKSPASLTIALMDQLTLFKRDEASVKALIEQRAGKALSLKLTHNTKRVLSVKKSGEIIELRLHKVFLDAPAAVLYEISDFITGKKRAGQIRSFIRDKKEEIGRRPRAARTVTRGTHYDLKEIFESVNSAYFMNAVTSSISWGVRRGRRLVRKRTLGSFNYAANSITINPVLDSPRVPYFYLAFIVYHEMLHASFFGGKKMKRPHSKEFREKERLFGEYEQALRWEKENRV